MRKLTSIQFKAVILFIVFASNTILGFACALGVNTTLIEHISYTEEAHISHAHIHSNGEKHHHHQEKEPKEKDDCCNSHVVSFEHLDKIIATSVSIDFTLHFFESPTSLFLNTTLQSNTSSIRANNTFRTFHLPVEDIRVSIRSFQI